MMQYSSKIRWKEKNQKGILKILVLNEEKYHDISKSRENEITHKKKVYYWIMD